jgi:Na+-translocating ferredoxin:NAD+ oxidoreductase RnfD subunit
MTMTLSRYLHSMHVWTIVLLVSIAAAASLARNAFPLSLAGAIVSASFFDLALMRVRRRRLSFPLSAVITGLIIGSIAPFTAPPLVVILASLVAIISKHAIRVTSFPVFNPAALGLLASLALFSLGDEWWAAVSIDIAGHAALLTPLLILAAYKARKLHTSLSFLLMTAILYLAGGVVTTASDLAYALPYYFAFIMVPEPKTSPYPRRQQLAFGVSMAVLTSAFLFYNVRYAFFLALLTGNLAHAAYRTYRRPPHQGGR